MKTPEEVVAYWGWYAIEVKTGQQEVLWPGEEDTKDILIWKAWWNGKQYGDYVFLEDNTEYARGYATALTETQRTDSLAALQQDAIQTIKRYLKEATNDEAPPTAPAPDLGVQCSPASPAGQPDEQGS